MVGSIVEYYRDFLIDLNQLPANSIIEEISGENHIITNINKIYYSM